MKIKRSLEKNIPWWWYWLHPIDALVISHYGYMDIITDKDYYKGVKLELIKNEKDNWLHLFNY